jgi:hypothetical protein
MTGNGVPRNSKPKVSVLADKNMKSENIKNNSKYLIKLGSVNLNPKRPQTQGSFHEKPERAKNTYLNYYKSKLVVGTSQKKWATQICENTFNTNVKSF